MSKNIYSNIDEKQLRQLYVEEKKNSSEIRKLLGNISQTTFLRSLKHFGIERRGQVSKYSQLRDEKWLIEQYTTLGKSTRQIANEIGATRGAVYSVIKHKGLTLRTNEEGIKQRYPKGRWGKDASNWKGGRRRAGTEGKYIAIYSPSHPNHDAERYVLEHRLVMEKNIGRYLTKKEQVHHINGDKKDNRIENLELHADAASHQKRHTEVESENKRLMAILDEHGISY